MREIMPMQNHKKYAISPFRRDKERVMRRFQMNLEAIISKYDRPFADSDVLDLNDMTVVEDRGFLKRNEIVKIGRAKLASEKASSRWLSSGFDWNSTKDSTDSAFGSTHYSGTDDVSGPDYNHLHTRTQRFPGIEDEDANHGDDLIGHGSHLGDSGNEDTDSDVSGPTTTHKPLLYSPVHHQRTHDAALGIPCVKTKGNPSQRIEVEERRKRAHSPKKREAWSGVRSLEDEDIDEDNDDDDDPYNFKEELPSILEEKKRFVSKMQSILIDSLIDGDDVDEMNSQTEDETSAGLVESNETSGSLSAWSTLKTTPKRASKIHSNDSSVEVVKDQISKVSGRELVFNCDSDCTDSSTILAGNLNGREIVCPMKDFRDPHPKLDTDSEIPSQPPFKAICNSTMLIEFNPSDAQFVENSKSNVKLPMPRELVLEGQGEMYIGEVLQSNQMSAKQDDLITKKNKTYTTFIRSPAKPQKCEDQSGGVQSAKVAPRKPYTPMTKKVIQGESSESSPSITSKAQSRIRHTSRQLQTGFSYPHFNTSEIIENFKSPKPLVVPCLDLENLDHTPRRKSRQEPPAKSSESLRSALLRLQSPQARLRSGDIGSQKAMEIQPRSGNSDHEMTLVVEDQHLLDAWPKKTSSWNNCGIHLRGNRKNLTENTNDQDLDHDESTKNIHAISPENCKLSDCGAMENGKSDHASPQGDVRQVPSKAVQKIHAPHGEHPKPTCEEKTPTRASKNIPTTRPSGRLVSEVKQTKECPSVQKNRSCEETLKQSGQVSLRLSEKAGRVGRMSNIGSNSGLNEKHPRTEQSASKNKEATVKEVVKPIRSSRQTSQEDALDIRRRDETETPVSSKIRRATKYPPTTTVGKSPSTHSLPLTQTTLASPQEFQNHKQILENRRTSKSGSMEHVTTPVKWSTKPKPREKDTRRSKDEKMNRTHMTILASDDSSVEEMEVDPYSLTADDSSPSPKLQSNQLQSNPLSSTRSSTKSWTKQFKSPCLRSNVKSQTKDLAADQRMLLRKMSSKRNSEGQNHLKMDGRFHASWPSDSCRSVEGNVISKNPDDDAKRMKRPNSRSKDHMGTSQHVIDESTSPQSTPGHDSTSLRKQESKKASEVSSRLKVRRDHSQYFSEDEYNSSGDDAKFLTSAPYHSRHEDESFDETYSDLNTSSKHRKFYVSEKAGALTHMTIVKCGKIISSPKSKRSPPDIHTTKRALLNSPAKTPNRTSLQHKVNRRDSLILFPSPLRCPSEFSGDEPLQLSISSPLRTNSCNVIASYSCKGTGNCNKPFCFTCALAAAR